MPSRRGAMTSLTFFTASSTPFPPKRFGSPSRGSTASCCPVEAPLGTAARPAAPLASVTSASRVGFPRLSRISRARTAMIVLMVAPTLHNRRGVVNAPLQFDDGGPRQITQRLAIVEGQPRRGDRLPDEDADRLAAQPPGALGKNLEGVVHVDGNEGNL